MKKPKTFTWVGKIEIAECWVADGFDLTPERLHSILANALPYAQGFEIQTAILKKPQASRIRKAQGYRK